MYWIELNKERSLKSNYHTCIEYLNNKVKIKMLPINTNLCQNYKARK